MIVTHSMSFVQKVCISHLAEKRRIMHIGEPEEAIALYQADTAKTMAAREERQRPAADTCRGKEGTTLATYYNPVKLLFRSGTLQQLSSIIQTTGVRRLLLLTGARSKSLRLSGSDSGAAAGL